MNLDDHFAPTRMESLAGMQGLTDFGFSSDEENWMDAKEDSWDLTDRQQGAFPSIGDSHIDFGAGYVCGRERIMRARETWDIMKGTRC
jgi:hypothetical protein